MLGIVAACTTKTADSTVSISVDSTLTDSISIDSVLVDSTFIDSVIAE